MRSHRRLFLLSLLVALQGCSGKEEAAEEPAEETSEADEPAEPADAQLGQGEAAEGAEAAAPATPAPAAPAAPAEPAGFDGKPVPRYVTSYALHVRSGPSKESPVVGYVKWGDKVEVVVNGEWAKLGEGRYIAVSRLSEQPPKAGGSKKRARKAK